MFQLSRYDFTTVKGDILTGIYDRFMDRNQRKKLGEFYTPPSIARYIIKRVGIDRHSRVLDPACGSGTFLIEAYRTMVGLDVERGVADYSDVLDAFSRIAGNDLNTFSSVLAQIQLLWQILGMRDDIKKSGFPDIMVTGKVNSLIIPDKWASLERFNEIDQPIYDAVIGNPPYVRAERSAQELDQHTINYFEHGRDGERGISAKRNAYTLFIYRALNSWCKPIDDEGKAGKLGFIVPVSLFDANETEELRHLFRIGGRWTIREIIDLEIIYKQVFDADVLPAIIIFENRPATANDIVSVRLASHECVKRDQLGALTSFDFESLVEEQISYADMFTPDGRIMTRLTPERLSVIRKIWKCGTLKDAAKKFWVGKTKYATGKITDKKPDESAFWNERCMLSGGIAFRNQMARVKGGHAVYKGENIVAAEIQGEPVEVDVDLSGISDNSLWAFGSVLPQKGYAIARIAHCPNAAAFDSTQTAFTNTATIFFPRDDLSNFPFDLLFLSNIYIFFYALAARMGVLRTLRSNIYPTNLGLMPWCDALATVSNELEKLRQPLSGACKKRFQVSETLNNTLSAMKLDSLKTHLRNDKGAHVIWAECFDSSDFEAEIVGPRLEKQQDSDHVVFLSDDMLEWLDLTRGDLAEGLAMALELREGDLLSKTGLLNIPIPVSEEERSAWKKVITDHEVASVEAEMDVQLAILDNLVGQAIGLTPDDISFVRSECNADPFLRGIKPRYPGTETRKQGFRTGLDSSSRYE
jgi:SAM-dependent methyltransferase